MPYLRYKSKKWKLKQKRRERENRIRLQKLYNDRIPSLCHPELFVSIEKIQKLAKLSDEGRRKLGFSDWDGFINYAEEALNIISMEYNISPFQAVIFSVLLNHYDNEFVQEFILAQDLGVSKICLIKYQNDINSLIQKKLIQYKKEESGCGLLYRIVPEVVNALRNKKEYISNFPGKPSLEEFFIVVNKIFEDRYNGWLDFKQFIFELRSMITDNKHLRFCKLMNWLDLSDINLMIYMFFFYRYSYYNINSFYFSMLRKYTENHSRLFNVERVISNGKHFLIENGILEIDDKTKDIPGFETDEVKYRVSDSMIESYLSELQSVKKQIYENNKNSIKLNKYKES